MPGPTAPVPGTILHIGMDDTDSPRGMCTTYLAYRLAGELARRGAEFLDFPRLVRLNPNVPWRTRGNGAVSLSVRTGDPGGARRAALSLLRRHADTGNGANPGIVFVEGGVPPALAGLAREALCRLVPRREAWRAVDAAGAERHHMGNGQGVVGAASAVGYVFGDSTLELLAYRRRRMFGTKRRISAESVRRMDEATRPHTFCSYDARRRRPLVAPRGPDPVFCGVRGESAGPLLRAASYIEAGEELDGHMIFRSNQGTGDHMRRPLDPSMPPYASGTVSGIVGAPPSGIPGRHAAFTVVSGGSEFACAAYRETGLAPLAMRLAPGDEVRVGGGVRRASARRPRTINVEFIRVVRAAPRLANPPCGSCGRRMKSRGRGQGFGCGRCGTSSCSRVIARGRGARRGLYLPRDSALRHLARPAQRIGLRGGARFDPSGAWYSRYGSGE